ncbi:MAG: hypothetical protein ABGY11_02160 [Candidatus Thioglobus sp.]
MYEIDYYPYRKKLKYKSRWLILVLMLICLSSIYWLITLEQTIIRVNPELIMISEPNKLVVMNKETETVIGDLTTEEQYLNEIEELDEVLQSQAIVSSEKK